MRHRLLLRLSPHDRQVSSGAAQRASQVLRSSFVCATATAHELISFGHSEVTFVVSGGLDAEEDLACAELIAAITSGREVQPDPLLRRAERSRAAEDLRASVVKRYTGVTSTTLRCVLRQIGSTSPWPPLPPTSTFLFARPRR